ncbi:WhiB family transcriptional regulator [Nonomuraea typhae]|uniref:WhiB family transcriptional regulator n=1 Tax=Nonomuraea typhae TaxID=2603600 RepID=UPI0012FC28E8|nr:WhiB family transcriptional regulator [Nonomuraea typhae]
MSDTDATGSWQDSALCAQADPEAWFPEAGEHAIAARQICQSCPVREPCLQDALERDEPYGIRAGLSPPQRRRLKVGLAA